LNQCTDPYNRRDLLSRLAKTSVTEGEC